MNNTKVSDENGSHEINNQETVPEQKVKMEFNQQEIRLLVTSLMATIMDCGTTMKLSKDPLEKMVCAEVGMESVEILKRFEPFLPKEEEETEVGPD